MLSIGVIAAATTSYTKGIFYALALTTSPGVRVYKEESGVQKEVTLPITLASASHVSFSKDGKYLAVASAVSPYVFVFKRSGNTFKQIATPANLPTGAAYSLAWHPNGTYLAVGHAVTPFITVYKFENDVLTKVTNSTTGYGLPYGMEFSYSGGYLMVASSVAHYLTKYKFSSGVLTTSDFSNGDGYPYGIATGPNDHTWIAAMPGVSGSSSPLFGNYTTDTGYASITFANNTASTFGALRHVDITPDGAYCIATRTNASSAYVWAKSTDYKYTSKQTLSWSEGYARAVKYSASGTTMMIATTSTTYPIFIFNVSSGTHTLNRKLTGNGTSIASHGDWYSEV